MIRTKKLFINKILKEYYQLKKENEKLKDELRKLEISYQYKSDEYYELLDACGGTWPD